MKVALKVGYDGTRFEGSQVQPAPAKTVEGEFLRVLGKLGIEDARPRWAGRTDAGVSALGNVAAIETDFDFGELPKALNANLNHVWVTGIAKVGPRFNPRFARERWYRYHFWNEDWDVRAAKRAASIFVGEHDFINFARIEEDKDPVRKLTRVGLERDGEWLLLDVRGENFLWQMVRRIGGAVRSVGLGKCKFTDVERALEGEKPQGRGFEPLPPEPLWLMDVEYDFTFQKVAPGHPIHVRRRKASLHARLMDSAARSDE